MTPGPGDRPAADIVGAGDRWIPEAEYQTIMARVPILCVDVLLSQPVPPGSQSGPRFGLIRRETRSDGEGWCLIGGAVLRGEPLADAVFRHVRATLGTEVVLDPVSLRPLLVAQYLPEERPGYLRDSRKHAVSITFVGELSGTPVPIGESLDFDWFERPALDGLDYCFGQGDVVSMLLRLPASAGVPIR
jgi:ADP-ribose pyrophosphatase YjhB (NUDIX family)